METLEIESVSKQARKWLGGFLVLAGLALFIFTFGERPKALYIITSIVLSFYGLFTIFNGFGLNRIWLREGSDCLIIKWSDKIYPVRIPDSGISKIILEDWQISVFRKSDDPLKFNIIHFGKDEKGRMHNFLTKYAEARNISFSRET